MKVRSIDRAIFEAECGLHTHIQWSKKSVRKDYTKDQLKLIGNISFHKRIIGVYNRRLEVLRSYRKQIMETSNLNERAW